MKNNKVTDRQIKSLLDNAQTQEHIFWGKELARGYRPKREARLPRRGCSYKLESGFTILGRAACVDPNNFDIEVGRRVAKADAENQLWQLEGYRLQLVLAGLIQEVSN